MLTLLSKGVPTKLLKFFWLKIFVICHRCQRHRWSTLSYKYLCDFWKKFEMILMGYSGAGGKLIHKKTQKQKISWHCPFKWKILLDFRISLGTKKTYSICKHGNIDAMHHLGFGWVLGCCGKNNSSKLFWIWRFFYQNQSNFSKKAVGFWRE